MPAAQMSENTRARHGLVHQPRLFEQFVELGTALLGHLRSDLGDLGLHLGVRAVGFLAGDCDTDGTQQRVWELERVPA